VAGFGPATFAKLSVRPLCLRPAPALHVVEPLLVRPPGLNEWLNIPDIKAEERERERERERLPGVSKLDVRHVHTHTHTHTHQDTFGPEANTWRMSGN